MNELAQTLKSAREALGMSIEQAAKASDVVAVEYITALEAGTVKRPAPFILYYLAGVYCISYMKLMEQCGYIYPTPLDGELRAI